MKFSVLLPTRNGGKFLANCIASVLEEPYQDMELVVSDNANIDETRAVLDYFSADKRLKVVLLKKPVCVTDNWNRALEASRGDYILMIGDDDCLLPGYFHRMESILSKYNNPDCVTYNAYSFIVPYSVDGDARSYYKDPFFNFGPEFKNECLISKEKRLSIVKDMFCFSNRIPLNMQTTLMSRSAMNQIKNGVFQPPFPDHYALNSLLLLSESWVFVPEKLLVVGVTPKSFGHFVYNDKQDEGKKYLGISSDFKGILPGIELNNCMYIWLTLLKTNYAGLLKNVKISRASYVQHQVYSWYLQYKSGASSAYDLLQRFCKLTFADWVYLLLVIFNKQSWRHLWLMLRDKKNTKIQNIWVGAQPLDKITNIKEFVNWINKHRQ